MAALARQPGKDTRGDNRYGNCSDDPDLAGRSAPLFVASVVLRNVEPARVKV